MKKLFSILASLCFLAAIIMYFVGSDSSHLSELKDLFWVPIPLGIIFLILSRKNKAN